MNENELVKDSDGEDSIHFLLCSILYDMQRPRTSPRLLFIHSIYLSLTLAPGKVENDISIKESIFNMDPEGNYESRLSYTTKSSRDVDIKADDGDPLSEAPEEDRADVATSERFGDDRLGAWEDDYEEKKRAYDYIGASAPPLSGEHVPVPAEDGTCSPSPSQLAAEEDACKPSPVANSDTKCLSPPDEPALNSVVVPIGPGAVESLPVALPIVTNAVGGGPNATLPLPEVPETYLSATITAR